MSNLLSKNTKTTLALFTFLVTIIKLILPEIYYPGEDQVVRLIFDLKGHSPTRVIFHLI